MKILVCIGSSCHLKGAREIIEKLQCLIEEHAVSDKVELAGTFCMNDCQNGVCVKLDDTMFSLHPETTEDFFRKEVLDKL